MIGGSHVVFQRARLHPDGPRLGAIGQIPIKPRRLSSTSEHRPHRFNNLVRHHDAYLHLIQIHIRLVLPVYTLSKSGTSRWNFLRSINIIAEADMSGQKAFRG